MRLTLTPLRTQEGIGAIHCIDGLKIVFFKKLVTTCPSIVRDCAIFSTPPKGTVFSIDFLHDFQGPLLWPLHHMHLDGFTKHFSRSGVKDFVEDYGSSKTFYEYNL